MKRSYLHMSVDILLFVGAVGLVLTGLLVAFVLPAGSRQASVWGITRHEWGDIHFWIAMGIIGMALVHLTLNWGWVCGVTAKMLGVKSTKPTVKRKLVTGLASVCALAVLVGGFLFTAQASKVVDTRDRAGRGQGSGQLAHDLQELFMDDRVSR